MTDKITRAIKALTAAGLLLFLLAGLAKTLFLPEEINEYENRPADKVSMPDFAAIMDGSFQDSVDKALADQVLLSTTAKKKYNAVSSSISNIIVRRVLELKLPRYISVGDMKIFGGDNITYGTRKMENLTEALDFHIENINGAVDPAFTYLYYIEKDTDINFETDEKVGVFEYLQAGLNLDSDHMSCFRIDSFDDFQKKFYKTDHHWNADGSYEAYQALADLLCPGDECIPKGETFKISNAFRGSKARGSYTELFSEEMWAYHFDFPEMTYVIDGEAADDYGNQNRPEDMSYASYGQYYGGDNGNIIINGGKADGEKILVIGESYDNAVLKLLAAHFAELHSVDLRYYSEKNGQFHLAEYLEKYSIDKLLLIGNIDYFIADDFLLEE
ncbi:MAG: DHHW family protein [Clostridia bacterium]|nr:DHHW family protein [Clostridia bacterium]